MGDEEIRKNCVTMCGHFHESVRHASKRFRRELGRHNYVTPTSYLALIWTFKSLLTGKRDEILNLKTRYEMGLGKLEFASSQVRGLLCKEKFFFSLQWHLDMPAGHDLHGFFF